MPLKKCINGVYVDMTPEEEQAIRADWAAADTRRLAQQQEADRLAQYDTAIAGDMTLAQLKAMSNSEFDAWWDSNITSAAAAIAVLKRLARVVIRRVL